jgi:hypothetical protein
LALVLFGLTSHAEQLKSGRELENPFPPAPSVEEAQTLMSTWAREDTITKLNQILGELSQLRAEVRRIRKAQCQCPASLSPTE